jgi:hydroxymethylbilane synthase
VQVCAQSLTCSNAPNQCVTVNVGDRVFFMEDKSTLTPEAQETLRRQAQCLNLRPDLDVRLLRGNVDTRLEKLRAGEADAILLAASGLNRLGLGDLPRSFIDPHLSPPAPGQGALAIQTRETDQDAPWLAALRHAPTALAVAAERGAMAALEGSCRTAIGAHARLEGLELSLIVEALTPTGSARFRREGQLTLASLDDHDRARALGVQLGDAVRLEGGALILLPETANG